jgi:peptide chain release factor
MSDRMIQVSTGTGPVEVRWLVRGLADALAARLAERGVEVGAVATVGDPDAPSSVALVIGEGDIGDMLGSHCVVAPLRGRAARRRWHLGVTVHGLPEAPTPLHPEEVEVRTCRAAGPGGQHVQKTETAVVAVHLPTGLRVRADGERSQHQNRRAALARLAAALAWRAAEAEAALRQAAWRAHHQLVRGAPVATWRLAGEALVEVTRSPAAPSRTAHEPAPG